MQDNLKRYASDKIHPEFPADHQSDENGQLAAKLRRAQDSIIQMRPYAQKLQELLSNIVSSSDGDLGSSLAVERPVEKVC